MLMTVSSNPSGGLVHHYVWRSRAVGCGVRRSSLAHAGTQMAGPTGWHLPHPASPQLASELQGPWQPEAHRYVVTLCASVNGMQALHSPLPAQLWTPSLHAPPHPDWGPGGGAGPGPGGGAGAAFLQRFIVYLAPAPHVPGTCRHVPDAP